MKQPKLPNAKPPPSPKVPGPSGSGSGSGAKRKPAGSEPFDLWLTRGLHQIYDDIANEPIPDDLRKLIEEDRSK